MISKLFCRNAVISSSGKDLRSKGYWFETQQRHCIVSFKTPIPLDGDSTTIRNFGQNDTNRSRNGKSAVEVPRL